MAAIRSSTATIATLYTHFLIFVIVTVFNFVVVDNLLPVNLGYGAALIFLSLISLLLSATSQDTETSLLRSVLMTTSALWTAIGLFHVVEFFADRGVTDSETLFAGYGTFLLIFLFYIFGALHHKDRVSAVLALGMFLSCIFEIAGLWRPLRRSAAAYYLLLAAITLYLTISQLLSRYREGEPKKKEPKGRDPTLSKDYISMAHAMNTLAAAVYAGSVVGIYSHASFHFTWVVIAGVYQIVAAVLAVRRNEIFHGLYFMFHGTFWLTNGFNLAVVYVTQVHVPLTLIAATVIHFILFAIIAFVSLTREVYQLPQNLALCVMCVAILIDDNDSGPFLGAMGWILFVISLYSVAAHISRIRNSGFKLPLGTRLVDPQKVTNYLLNTCKCCFSHIKTTTSISKESNSLFSSDFTLGYSRYGGFDVAGFALNAVAAVAILWTPQGLWVLPWAIVLGGLAQMIVGSICFAKGLSFESCAFFTFGSLWLIWGPARGLGTLANDNSAAIITGCVGFLAVGLLLLGLSTTINKAWSVLTFLFNLVIVGVLLHSVNANGSFIYEIVINVLFVIVCIYCFIATALRSVWGKELLPLGKPFLQVSFLHSQGDQAFWADGRKASGVKAIAEIMNKGGICGIPTDTVYVLAAALKFPQAVERAYNTKKLAEDRPMSMWISKTEQLSAGRPLFGELVWGLMNEIWPSTVSLVVPKGEWVQTLGVGASEKFIGRPDSIACRMPDNTVTSHLIDQVGPISTSSANPTGEADTTHHLQVIAKLGLENCDGILCSGPSPENMASTVVDCRQLKDGRLSFFRIGVVPRSHVEAIFAKVKAIHEGVIPPSPTTPSPLGGGPHVNTAFQDDQNNSTEKIYDDAVINNDDSDSGHADVIPSNSSGNSNNTSLDMSFAESTIDDDAHLITPKTLTTFSALPTADFPNRQSTASGIAGRINKVYESLNPKNPSRKNSRNQGDHHQDSTRVSNASSISEDPYEPMQIMATRSGADIIRASKQIGGKTTDTRHSLGGAPAFSVNPLYNEPNRSQNERL